MSHPQLERVKKSVRLDVRAIAIIAQYAIEHSCTETDALNRLIISTATRLPPISHPLDTSHPLPPDGLEERLMALEDRVSSIAILETQMKMVVDRLDAIDRTNPTQEQLEIPILDPALSNSGSNPVESISIESRISPQSDRDSGEAGTSTLSDPVIEQAIIDILKPLDKGGYYFRSEDLGQDRISHSYRLQALKMGFKSATDKKVRVWLNRDYCLQPV